MSATGTQQKWQGRWEQLSGRVKSLWGDITDDDLLSAKGDYEALIGKLKEKTGKTREELERAIGE